MVDVQNLGSLNSNKKIRRSTYTRQIFLEEVDVKENTLMRSKKL